MSPLLFGHPWFWHVPCHCCCTCTCLTLNHNFLQLSIVLFIISWKCCFYVFWFFWSQAILFNPLQLLQLPGRALHCSSLLDWILNINGNVGISLADGIYLFWVNNLSKYAPLFAMLRNCLFIFSEASSCINWTWEHEIFWNSRCNILYTLNCIRNNKFLLIYRYVYWCICPIHLFYPFLVSEV